MTPSIVSLVVPTLNEAESITPFLESVTSVLAAIPHEILVVDDNSPDGTGDVAARFSSRHPEVRVIRRTGAPSLSGSVLDGFKKAEGDIFAVMDADRSHDEKILPALIRAVREGADMAVGSRRVAGGGADKWPWYRRFMSNIATRVAKCFLHVPLADPMSGYFAIHRRVYEMCKNELAPQGYKIMLELYCRARVEKTLEIPYVFQDRRQGHSKLTPLVARQYLSMVWTLRDKRRLLKRTFKEPK